MTSELAPQILLYHAVGKTTLEIRSSDSDAREL